MSGAIDLSVVVPVYGCESCLRALHRRVVDTLEPLVGDFELLLVDDRGPDGSWDVARELAETDVRVRAFRLTRNFGQHLAITAGLAQARGRRVVVMDCDLQDPPEEIPRLLAKAEEGYDIVFTRRQERQHHPVRRATANLYFRLLNRVAGSQIDRTYGSFVLMSRSVVDAFLRFKDADRHFLLILYWLGFDHTAIEYAHAQRFAGRSSYSPRALVVHALGGLFFQTTVLLRWIVYLGFALATLGIVLALVLVGFFFFSTPPPGWTSLAGLTLVLSGFIIMSTGVTGLYVGKVFDQVRERPLFLLDEVVDRSADEPAMGEAR